LEIFYFNHFNKLHLSVSLFVTPYLCVETKKYSQMREEKITHCCSLCTGIALKKKSRKQTKKGWFFNPIIHSAETVAIWKFCLALVYS